ncbi:CPBP family glutamic-type intramembrane protease [Nocardiopsis dassonvillei]|uniref:CPBP family glutamic-type intramembrane protease n=1 Tax=Nocardiopsis dassonvillei TaxID=2014 RepID=UPI00200CC54A|nr:CPBP family glutamic-type intramembrane protease [Nocardiopsis dassonvillei]MCK9869226.1 CPBP family glutamic-type intramembrane protease [Nocardiopsis dassonvillei]
MPDEPRSTPPSDTAPRAPGAARPRAGPVALAVLVSAAATLVGVLAAAASMSVPGPAGDPDSLAALAVRAALCTALVPPLLWAARRFLDRAPTPVFGLVPRGWPVPLAAALTVLLASAVLLGAAWALGAATPDTGAVGGAASALAVALPLLLAAQILPEELVFRGYAQHHLGLRFSPWAAVAVQAALYTLFAAAVTGSAALSGEVFLLGLFLGALRTTTGEVWTPLAARTALTAVGVLADDLGLLLSSAPGPWQAVLSLGPGLVAFWVVYALRGRTSGRTGDPFPDSGGPRRSLAQKGILYDVGSSYLPGQHSRPRWRPEVVDREMRVIREDLHCTAVTVFGEDVGRLEEAARLALDRGLYVWIQPRLVDAAPGELTANLGRAAEAAERLRRDHPGQVGLNVGCEISLFAAGVLPGRDLDRRTRALGLLFPLLPWFDRRLNRLLRELAGTARARFHGPLTYGSGVWETVDWTPFDVVGADYYLDELTCRSYRQGLRRLRAHGKPVVVTEFGCCSYEGARDRGGSGADILDWSDLGDRRVRGGYVRDERVQADLISDLLDVFETEEVHGAFVCMFIEGDCRYSPDPTRDQDMASFGIVRPPPLESELSPDDGHWEPKLAFHTLAARYAEEGSDRVD